MYKVSSQKRCRRCGGDLFLEIDTEGSYVFCLQCSTVYDERELDNTKATAQEKKTPIFEEALKV